MRNRLGMQFIGYDEKYVLLGTFADAEGVKYIVDLLNQLNNENKELKQFQHNVFDLIDKKINKADTIGAEILKDLKKELTE